MWQAELCALLLTKRLTGKAVVQLSGCLLQVETTFVGVPPVDGVMPKETSWTSEVRVFNARGKLLPLLRTRAHQMCSSC